MAVDLFGSAFDVREGVGRVAVLVEDVCLTMPTWNGRGKFQGRGRKLRGRCIQYSYPLFTLVSVEVVADGDGFGNVRLLVTRKT